MRRRRAFWLLDSTNGTLLTPDLVELFREWYPVMLDVSLYGLSAETYEKVTGVASAFNRAMRGIELLSEAGVPFSLKSMAMTLTKDEIPAMYDLAAQFGVQFRHDGMIWRPFTTPMSTT